MVEVSKDGIEGARRFLDSHTLGFLLLNDERQELARIMVAYAATLQAERDRYKASLLDGAGNCLIAIEELRKVPGDHVDAIRVFALIRARLMSALSDTPTVQS